MRFLTCDNAYKEAFDSLPHSTHEEWFLQSFGTSNYLDVALRSTGHEAKTLVRNFYSSTSDMMDDVREYDPDVILSREAGRFSGPDLRRMFPDKKLICTCSHAVDDAALQGFDAVLTSFPWFVDHLKSIGIRGEYLSLAFGRPVLDRIGELPKERDIPVCFIGGLGNRIWDQGTRTMAAIAEAIPDLFRWWGYVAGSLSDLPVALQKSYQGTAWGIEMYRLLARTKICLNRHGEIARGYGQNCRQWEAVGMGCYLLTDAVGEETYEATRYTDADNAIFCIRENLELWDARTKQNSLIGQKWILENGCFENRVPRFLSVVESL